MRLQAPRGTEDLLPGRSHVWQTLERRFFDLTARYGYGEVRTPMFEDVAVFKRTAGEASDIVQKEMYIFRDRGDRELALKPEGTASVVRALIEAGRLSTGTIGRYAYRTEIFRYGRPGRGRLRQGHQVGAELVGSSSAAADAEMIELAMETMRVFGVPTGDGGAVARVNSIGRKECRRAYGEAILAHLAPVLPDLDEGARARIELNPLGALDAKDPKLKEALATVPSIRQYLEPDSAARLEALERMLDEAGVPWVYDASIVRGLDYYTETVFEIASPAVPDLSLAGGGRYDDLVALMGGAATPCVGFAIGIERTLLALEAAAALPEAQPTQVFVVSATEEAHDAARSLTRELRRSGLAVLSDLDSRSQKSQFRQADASGAKWAAILGKDELAAGQVTLRDLKSGEQQSVVRDAAAGFLKEKV